MKRLLQFFLAVITALAAIFAIPFLVLLILMLYIRKAVVHGTIELSDGKNHKVIKYDSV